MPSPSPLQSSQQPFTALAYRRSSVPPLASSASHRQPAQPARRAPLMPIDLQRMPSNQGARDDQMSKTSSSPSYHSYAQPAVRQDHDHLVDLVRTNIGRPITTTSNAGAVPEASVFPPRRRSIPNHFHSLNPPPRPSAPVRSNRRRPPSSSVSSNRRPSLPTIHLHPSPPTTYPNAPAHQYAPVEPNNDVNSTADDLYSNLSSFTFGSAHTTRVDHPEMISPFTIPGAGSADRTPRPSLSGSTASRSRTPRTRTRDIDEDGTRADVEDEDEVEQQTRAKMRAMNDGTRRPSLPINVHPTGGSRSPARSSPSSSPVKESPSRPAHESLHESSEAESISSGHNAYAESTEDGDFDTDVELDYQHTSVTPAANDDMSDTASYHTFGRSDSHYSYHTQIVTRHEVARVSEDSGDARVEPTVVVTKVGHTAPDEDKMSVVEEEPAILPGDSSGMPTFSSSGLSRNREDSHATVTVRQERHSMYEERTTDQFDPASPLATNRPQSISQVQASALLSVDDANVICPWDGIDLDYVLGNHRTDQGHRRSWQSNRSGWMQPGTNPSASAAIAPFETFDFQGWGTAVTGAPGRRPSTVTVGSASGEDAFTRHIQRYDPVFSERALEWAFRKESADGPGQNVPVAQRGTPNPRMVVPAVQEIWRQAHVGRFKVDRLLVQGDDPMKPPSQRVHVRHIVDPFSRGNTRGGPVSVVHKHSRAIAFSIFRKYDLFHNRNNRPGGVSMPTSGSILLATKKVQEQYTSTKTTSQLNSHGLLRDSNSRFRGHSSTSGTTVVGDGTVGQIQTHNERPSKGKGKELAYDSTGSATASTGSSSSRNTPSEDEPADSVRYQSSSASSTPSMPVSPSIDTHFTHISSSSSDRSPRRDGPMNYDDDDDEMVPPRTSHAEAFATLDQSSIEYYRGRSGDHRLSDEASHSKSIAERLRRKLLGQNPVRGISKPNAGHGQAALEGHYTPPWLTMAPRSRVEERDRVIQNLNESFKDVGLLPSFKTKSGGRSRPSNREDTVNIFSHVPSDSLHMLLPLWPGETDAASRVSNTDPATYNISLEERQYLLVYYMPFEDAKSKAKAKQESKKRARSNSRAASVSASGSSKTVLLTAFSVCARLISYHDLLNTGVRVPVDGLSITGSMAEAMRSLPSQAIRDSRFENPQAIIGICSGRQKGVEFLPEGLAKVGLAVALPSDPPIERAKPFSSEAEEEEINWELTPIGRAAVEMAWLGALAMTSFGPESLPQKP